jgi:putative peptide zinc metalloprotease protein
LGDHGQYAVKVPQTNDFFHLREQECYLLLQLNGQNDVNAVCAAFTKRFNEPISEDDLSGFIDMAREYGLLQTAESEATDKQFGSIEAAATTTTQGTSNRQSILYWRKKFFDPDRLFNWLEPQIRLFWTRGFLFFSAACIVLAAWVLWMDRHSLAASVQASIQVETIFWAWLTLLVVSTLHEFAHGLTCKHYGGEVHEIGFLLLFFMPCFYCNVSDAWLFRERSKRLWVTFAGGYFELFLWALAVFVWRTTLPGSFPNCLALLIVVSSGIDTFFNFNPLIKLDGYYLLSDWLEVPNLQQRGVDCLKARLRWLLWGAPQPDVETHGGTLFTYGLVSWLYSLVFLSLILWGMFWLLGDKWGVTGMSAVTLIGLVSSRTMLKDTSNGEIRKMLIKRKSRLTAWIVVLVGLAAVLRFVEIEDRVGGKFVVRSTVRSELRASVAGFLKELPFDEGDQVSPGMVIARLEIPDLDTRLVQKRAQIREVTAKLRLLQAGARPEEVDREKLRVQRAKAWCDLARQDLQKMRRALVDESTPR